MAGHYTSTQIVQISPAPIGTTYICSPSSEKQGRICCNWRWFSFTKNNRWAGIGKPLFIYVLCAKKFFLLHYAGVIFNLLTLLSSSLQASAQKVALEIKEVSANVYVAMRYWHPFTEEAVHQVGSKCILLVLPVDIFLSWSFVWSCLCLLSCAHDNLNKSLEH